ncbi:type I restriction endonuclease subunit R [Mycoplasma procyoni]|uniref:type I restriction endonuclease subunit R n=1 Tax=Mycoplasma procyoni TaxID=568784 RepID=UPI00197C42C8|nr:HsdR family type I site-specific deoxyribonuclease [Mycoplasma procyoni]MBN3535129.1 type I restriction endonuclease subunit R [Mycoplasma procyoni]
MKKFKDEKEFHQAVIEELKNQYWDSKLDEFPNLLDWPTEEKLKENWRKIITKNNSQKERLGEHPLTAEELEQIIDQFKNMEPWQINEWINHGEVKINRLHPDAKNRHVTLDIFKKEAVRGGDTIYQIASEVIIDKKDSSTATPDTHRADLMLLINGMPIYHIELKDSASKLDEAFNQISTYHGSRKVFNKNFFSLVQFFVIMTPEKMEYFANVANDKSFNKKFRFTWKDENNKPIQQYDEVIKNFLQIPHAHEMLSYYSVADETDKTLKVLKSYQVHAIKSIRDVVERHNWASKKQEGGFIWHTTGSGKTLTSYKTAQILTETKGVNKVIFLMDRIELGKQTLNQFKNFAIKPENVNETHNAHDFFKKLKSKQGQESIIVTSIQKASKIAKEIKETGQISKFLDQKIVFISDEAHRSTFGDMMSDIKQSFPNALFFGFTGTPIFEDNNKGEQVTEGIFGKILHKYTIAEAIKDQSVLKFKISFEKDYPSEEEYRKWAYCSLKNIADCSDANLSLYPKDQTYQDLVINETWRLGHSIIDEETGKELYPSVESCFKNSFYNNDKYRENVVRNIIQNWNAISKNGKFHAIFATSSIQQAIEYYKMFKKLNSEHNLKVTTQFTISQNYQDEVVSEEEEKNADSINVLENVVNILDDYNKQFDTKFTISQEDYENYRADVADRLAHKGNHFDIDTKPEKKLDILIVVNQMLTGYDSKWVNTLYIDKIIDYANLIQAFSRTNRIFGDDKPHGRIVIFRKPNTMKENTEKALKLYTSEPEAVQQLPIEKFITRCNDAFAEIKKTISYNQKDNTFDIDNNIPEEKLREFIKQFGIFNTNRITARQLGMREENSQFIFVREDDSVKGIIIDFTPYNVKNLNNLYFGKARELLSMMENLSQDARNEIQIIRATSDFSEESSMMVDEIYLNKIVKEALINPSNQNKQKLKEGIYSSYWGQERDDALELVEEISQNPKQFYENVEEFEFTKTHNQRQELKRENAVNDFCEALGIEDKSVVIDKKNANFSSRKDFWQQGDDADILDKINTEVAYEYIAKKFPEINPKQKFMFKKKLKKVILDFILHDKFEK